MIAAATAVIGVQAACGTGAPQTNAPAQTCRALQTKQEQYKLDPSTAPTTGFALHPGTAPVGIIADRDGSSVWILGTGTNRVTHVTASGAAVDYVLPTSGLGLQLSQGVDGTVWVPEQHRGAVAGIAPGGTVRECALPGKGRQASATSAAADGSVWVSESVGSAIARLAGGKFTEHPIGIANAEGAEVVAARGGGAWFTLHGAPFLGRITAQGDLRRIPIGGSGTDLGLLEAPDGAVWVADFGGDAVIRVAPDLSLSQMKAPAGAKPQSFALGPGGVLWLTESGGDRIARVRGDGLEEVYRTGSWPDHLAITADGWAWFTEYNENRLGRVRLPAT